MLYDLTWWMKNMMKPFRSLTSDKHFTCYLSLIIHMWTLHTYWMCLYGFYVIALCACFQLSYDYYLFFFTCKACFIFFTWSHITCIITCEKKNQQHMVMCTPVSFFWLCNSATRIFCWKQRIFSISLDRAHLTRCDLNLVWCLQYNVEEIQCNGQYKIGSFTMTPRLKDDLSNCFMPYTLLKY